MFHIYIKQHKITKKKYLGFTKRKDPFKYKGSGKYWTQHIKKHGVKEVETLELYSFHTKQEAWEFAKSLSEKLNIVESAEWANLKPEGLDGGAIGEYNQERTNKILATKRKNGTLSNFGYTLTEETKNKISKTRKKKFLEGKIKPNITMLGKKHTEESRKKMSKSRIGLQNAKGKTWKRTDESKAKFSKKCIGRKRKILSNGSWTWEYPSKAET